MIISATVIPKSVVLIKYQYILLFHIADYGIDAICQSQAFTSGDKTGDGRTCFFQKAGFKFSIPPRGGMATSYQQSTVHLDTSVCNSYFRLCWCLVRSYLLFFHIIDWFYSGHSYWRSKGSLFNPVFQCQAGIVSLFGQFHSNFNGRTAGGACIPWQDTGTFCTFLLQTILQLSIENASGLHMIVWLCPFAVTGELCPTSVRTVHGIFCRSITLYFGSGTLPEQTICCIPSRSVLVLSQILETQIMPVYINHVKQ